MKDSFGDRMKSYEFNFKIALIRKIPVIIRVDGKSFHKFCKRFEKPYDLYFNTYMNNVMKYLCKNIQGAKFAERHSDEISILVTDLDSNETDAYFRYQVQKICSVVSSLATSEFCRQLFLEKVDLSIVCDNLGEVENKKFLTGSEFWPCFDCRCFNVPVQEVENYFWWRLKDAVRNSINMLSQSYFTHKELQGISCDEMQEMLFSRYKINWNNFDSGRKSGFICIKEFSDKKSEYSGEICKRSEWVIHGSPENRESLANIFSLNKLLSL
jgi:tRNA(His) guanylyltransferase